jgi:vancomycin resistance protein VanJ
MDVPDSNKVLEQPQSDPRDAAPAGVGVRWAKIAVAILSFGYLVALIGLIYYIRTWGDRTAAATILLFSPRWLFTLPLVLLIPLAAWFDRRLLIVCVITAGIALFGLLGFSLGWRRLMPSSPAAGPALRVLTLNTHYGSVANTRLAAYIQETHPDVVALQEVAWAYVRGIFKKGDWHYLQCSNNVLASRFPIDMQSVQEGRDFFHCSILPPCGPVEIAVLHLRSPHVALRDTIEDEPNGSSEIEQNVTARMTEAALIHEFITKQKLPLLLVGDFNLVPDSTIFRGNFADLSDAFEAGGFGLGYSYNNHWTRVRIDHVLLNDSFHCEDCFVGEHLGSPHRPVIADLIPLRKN